MTEIIPVKYANSFLPGNMVFYKGNFEEKYPIDFIIYLIKTDSKLILVDAGCETMPGFEMKNFIGPVKALEDINISVNDISDVVITHSHHDHVECVKYFKNSVIHIQKDEFESGKNYFTSELTVNTFDDEYTVCDGVKIVKIGGHSKGSCIVELNETTVFVGDECYLRDCIVRKIPTGATVCLEKSKEFIEKYSNPKYRLLFSHID